MQIHQKPQVYKKGVIVRKIIYSLTAASLLATPVFAKKVKLDKQLIQQMILDIKEVKKENAKLKQQLEQQSKKIKQQATKISNIEEQTADSDDAISDLEDTLEKVETATLTDKIKFSLIMKQG